MDSATLDLTIVCATVLALAFWSRRLARWPLTPPMIFLGVGLALGSDLLGARPGQATSAALHLLAEYTLVFLLFRDAARIDLRELRRNLGVPARLLVLGMPLVAGLGMGVAYFVFPALSFWEYAVLAAILTPTDAALGSAVVEDERVPERLRQSLDVESGLNDGLAVPLVTLAIALAADGSQPGALDFGLHTVQALVLGPVVGAAVGFGGEKLLQIGTDKAWTSDDFARVGGVAMAISSYAAASLVGGNGFVAAFCGGLAAGWVGGSSRPSVVQALKVEGTLFMLLVFLLFGGLHVAACFVDSDWRVFVYAGLSVFFVRVVGSGLALMGAGLRWREVLFVSFFGPRGVASLVFALLMMLEHDLPHADLIFRTVVVTVTFCTVIHGISAAPVAARFGGGGR